MSKETQKLWYQKNKELTKSRTKEWHKNNKVRSRELKTKLRNKDRNVPRGYQLKSQYGLTLEDYNKMLLQQNAVCKICKKAETRKTRWGGISSLSVDHCHVTGKVRGLLCFVCNAALGAFNDDGLLLQRAVEYLKCQS